MLSPRYSSARPEPRACLHTTTAARTAAGATQKSAKPVSHTGLGSDQVCPRLRNALHKRGAETTPRIQDSVQEIHRARMRAAFSPNSRGSSPGAQLGCPHQPGVEPRHGGTKGLQGVFGVSDAAPGKMRSSPGGAPASRSPGPSALPPATCRQAGWPARAFLLS